MATSPHVELIARGVCIRDGQLLLCRGRGARLSYLPGGHIEFRETARRALARELREELGRTARVGRFLGCVEHAFKQRGRWHAEVNVVFAVALPGLDPRQTPVSQEEWIAFEWFPLERLAQSRLEPAVLRRYIPLWLASADNARYASTRTGWLPKEEHEHDG